MADTIGDPRLQFVYEYWLSKRRGRLMPSRADLDPTELPVKLWPIIMLLDVVREGGRIRFRYRRVGGEFVREFGRDPTGGFLDEALPVRAGFRDYVVGMYQELVACRWPIYSENRFGLGGQLLARLTKRLSLPLSSDGTTVDMALACHVFEYDPSVLSTPEAKFDEIMEVVRTVLAH